MSSAPGVPSVPADIASRQFATARKGYDPHEVRAYLTEIASLVGQLEVAATGQRERADQAEAQFEHVEQVDERRMVELLGKETVRVLDAARVAASDIRRKAEESASRLISEANEEAHRVRAEAEAAVAAQRIELRAEVEAMRHQAEGELARRQAEGEELAAEMRSEATAECDALRLRAQEEGRQMVTEAQVVRERMLRDLARRRRGAREQLERLNAARDRLLAAYEVVRRTVDTATGELAVALPEAKVAGEAAMRRVHGEPEPSVQELDDLVAMARIAGLLDPRLEESILDEPEPSAGNGALDEAVADRGGAGRGFARAGGGGEAALPQAMNDVVAVEATVVDAADAVDALRELVVDDEIPEDDEPPEDDLIQGLHADSLDSLDTDEPPDPAATEPDAADVDEPDLDADDSHGTGVDGQLFHLDDRELPDVPVDAAEDLHTGPQPGHDDIADHSEIDEQDDVETIDDEWGDETDDGDAGDISADVPDDRPSGHSVDELFAQLRADRQHDLDEEAAAHDAPNHEDHPEPDIVAVGLDPSLTVEPPNGTSADAEAEAVEARSPADRGFARAGGPEPEEQPEAVNEEQPEAVDEHELLFRQRDETLAALEQTLSRRLKRVLADDQNEVLDLLRRVKSPDVDLDQELSPLEDHLARYVAAARDDLGQAATAGAVQVAAVAGFDGDCDPLAAALAETVAGPLRERVARSFDEAGGDVEELTGRLRSLFREWKAQRIGDAVRHFTVAAYAQGAYGAVPEGTPLRWLVDRSSDACPDADDNALAGAVAKGDSFPTGELHPPAHPGCRCLVAPIDQAVGISPARTGRARI